MSRARSAVLAVAGNVARALVPADSHARTLSRILVIKPDHLGDVLLAGPALQMLRQQFPHSHITLAVGPWSRSIAERLPEVDALEVITFPGMERGVPVLSPLQRWSLMGRTARQWHGRFDAGVLLREDYYWGAFALSAAGIRTRAGTATPDCAPLLTAAAVSRRVLAARSNLSVVANLCGLPDDHSEWMHQYPLRFSAQPASPGLEGWRARAGLAPGQPFVLVLPGAGTPVKLWPARMWSTTIRALHKRSGIPSVVATSASEQHLAQAILATTDGSATFAPVTQTLDDLAAYIRAASLVLGVDSLPLHLAVALDTPSLRLFGPADPAVFGPWGDPSRHHWIASPLLCAPCDRLVWDQVDLPWHPCMRKLAPVAIVDVAQRMLAGLPTAPDTTS